MTELWAREFRAADLPAVGREIARLLTASSERGGAGEFCLWLQGPLGAGKTTLTGHVLRALGLPAAQPVTSPTYTYMNEYKIKDSTGELTWYAHLDLYRATGSLSSDDLGLLDVRQFRGIFVEWPEKLAGDPGFAATHVLAIEPTTDDDIRRATLKKV